MSMGELIKPIKIADRNIIFSFFNTSKDRTNKAEKNIKKVDILYRKGSHFSGYPLLTTCASKY
jgi:hypothetical protein